MAWCKTAVTPLLMHWSYSSSALTHRFEMISHQAHTSIFLNNTHCIWNHIKHLHISSQPNGGRRKTPRNQTMDMLSNILTKIHGLHYISTNAFVSYAHKNMYNDVALWKCFQITDSFRRSTTQNNLVMRCQFHWFSFVNPNNLLNKVPSCCWFNMSFGTHMDTEYPCMHASTINEL